MRFLAFLILVLVSSAWGCQPRKATPSIPPPPVPPSPGEAGDFPGWNKLDSALQELVKAFREGGSEAAFRRASENGVPVDAGRVEVHIVVDPVESLQQLKDRVLRMDGVVRAEFENNLYVAVAPEGISVLIARDEVWLMALNRPVFEPAGAGASRGNPKSRPSIDPPL